MLRRRKIILAVLGVGLVWPFAQIGLVAAQAQYYANGRPYCMDASSGRGRYSPVTSLLELNGFSLQAPFIGSSGSGSHGFMQWTFHAVLAIDIGSATEWRNWSYWHQHFDRLTPEQARATGLYGAACQPQTDFTLKLPLSRSSSLRKASLCERCPALAQSERSGRCDERPLLREERTRAGRYSTSADDPRRTSGRTACQFDSGIFFH
jgi:hypothetical protein